MELCPATVTDLGLRARPAIQLEDSAPAGSTSSAVSAQSVLQDTMASPTADVSNVPRKCSAICSVANIFSNTSSLPSAVCECGRRLCDEVTGKCICPPQTVKPSCEVCQAQTFNYHPLLGCDDCECSPTGITDVTRPDCDSLTGQCTWVKTYNRHICDRSEHVQLDLPSESLYLTLYFSSCKPRIGGRQCDRCAPGYYRFPECIPCNCNRDGVTPDVCHPDTGRCLCKVTLVDLKPPPWIFLSWCRVALSCIVVIFAEKCCWHQVWLLQGRLLLLWPLQPSRLHQLLLFWGN